MSSRSLGATGVVLLALIAPASAAAVPTMQPLKPCYVTASTSQGPQQEAIAISATGFTPNSKVDLAIDGALLPGGDNLQTDQTGALNVPANSVPAPFVAKGSKDFTVTLTEDGNPANTVSATAKSTALGVSVKPRRARPSSKVRFKGSGFTREKPVYAHYIYKGKVRKRVRMAGRTGTCGTWSARRPQIPVDEPGTGSWIVQFQQGKKFFKPENARSPFVRLEIVVSLQRG